MKSILKYLNLNLSQQQWTKLTDFTNYNQLSFVFSFSYRQGFGKVEFHRRLKASIEANILATIQEIDEFWLWSWQS